MATTTDSQTIAGGHGGPTVPYTRPPRGASIPLGTRQARLNPFYGLIVSGLKVLLPTLAIALIILVVAWPHIEEQERQFGRRLIGLEGTKAENLEVKNARYNGLESNGNPYSVSAESVRQADVDSPLVELNAPKADIQIGKDNWAMISAKTGHLDRDAQVLELNDEVNLFHDLGYEFHTQSLTLDLLAGTAYGCEPVWGQGPFGNLEAEGVRIFNRGERVELTGKSKVIFYDNGEGQ